MVGLWTQTKGDHGCLPLCEGHPSNGISARYDLEADPNWFSLEGGIEQWRIILTFYEKGETVFLY